MKIGSVKEYLTSPVKTPYFLFISDSQYRPAIDELSVMGLDFVQMSAFCSGDDKLPDIDGLLTYIEAADVNAKGKMFVVTGVGEYLALRGNKEASRILSRLKDINVGDAKVVLVLRGLVSHIAELQTDPRFDNRRYSVVDKAECNLSFTLAAPSVGLLALSGFKAMLAELEKGRCGSIAVNTAIDLNKSLFAVHIICNAYEGVKSSTISFNLQCSCGSDDHWAELLKELMQNDGLLDSVFEKNGFISALEADFYVHVAGNEYRNWLYFIALKSKSDTLSNSYLRFVLDNTNRFEDFKTNVLNAIIEVPHTDKRFLTFYAERKKLIEKFPESDIANFVINNRKHPAESIYRLTDVTKTEREEVIAWVSQNRVIPQIADIYPALEAYLKKFIFNCGDLSNLLTEYFDQYKLQKVSNKLERDFMEKVEKFAKSRDYNRLPTRNEVIDGLNKEDTYLYWLDALGVEYLAFIMELARMRGLSISINIARAELPTITSINRDFFDAWEGDRKEKSEELDDTKHKEKGGYNFKNNALPIHLARELDIIFEVIGKAATKLALRHYKRFLIVSDHGASRLAVLRRKEEQYETDTKGEHSGRCCKLFKPYDLPFAAEENGYLVLADYGRFRGSRAANVEVHGGASLEEVVVPVIELKLKDNRITVEMVEKFVTVDYRMGTEITLFFNSSVKNVSVLLNGKRYTAILLDGNRYKVALPDVKRAGDYPADVYTGDDLVGKIVIRAQGKSGKVNVDFDDLF